MKKAGKRTVINKQNYKQRRAAEEKMLNSW